MCEHLKWFRPKGVGHAQEKGTNYPIRNHLPVSNLQHLRPPPCEIIINTLFWQKRFLSDVLRRPSKTLRKNKTTILVFRETNFTCTTIQVFEENSLSLKWHQATVLITYFLKKKEKPTPIIQR